MGGWARRLAWAAGPVALIALAGALVGPAVASAATVGSPAAPTGVTAAPRDQGALVSWTPPSDDGGSPITGYVITVTPGGESAYTAAVTTFQVGGLTNGRAYTFTVAAVNVSGQGPASLPSPAVMPRAATAPGRVQSVTAVAGYQQVSVSWAAPGDDGGAPVTGYQLTTTPGGQSITVAGEVRTATLTGLSDGTAYWVLVAAVNSAGTGQARMSHRVIPQVTVPGQPTGVTAASESSGAQVSWQPPQSDGGSAITGYAVTVAETGQTITAGPDARSVTIGGLTQGASYGFTVAAVNVQGQGPGQTSDPVTAGGAVNPAAVVLSDASLASLAPVKTNGSLVFASPPPQVQDLAAGDVLVAGVSPVTPDGLLAMVVSVTTSGTTVTVATAPASLDDALSVGGFGTSATLARGQVAAFTPARPGVRLLSPGVSPAATVSGSISLGLDTTLYKSADGRSITVDGSVSLSPSVSFSAGISCCFHTRSRFTGSVTASASLGITADVSHSISGGYTLGTFRFDPITFDVLGVPVVIVPKLTVKLIAKGSVTAGLTASAGESVTVGARITTKDGQVSAEPFSSSTTSYTPPTLYGTLNAAGGAEADLSATVDGVAGATLTDQLWLAELSVDPSRTPWWTLSLENVVDADFDLTLLDHTFGSYDKTLSDVTVQLAQATGPYQGITVSPDPAVTEPGGTLQLSAQVAGVAGQDVAWQVPSGNGSITSGGVYTAPATPGTYQVTATQPPSGLQPAAFGLISIQVGDQPPGPPTGPAATSASYGEATVTWNAPAETGGGAITGYSVTAEPGGSTYPVPGSVTSDTIGGLTPGSTYTFTVTAASDGGTGLPSPATSPVEIDNVLPSGGSGWTATKAQMPANAAASPSPQLPAISCPSPAACTAAGTYQTAAGSQQGLLVTGTGTSWAGTEAPLPANAASALGQEAALHAVACGSSTSCAAGGYYLATPGTYQGLLVTGSGTSWTGTQAPLPAGAATGTAQDADIQAVACPSATACVATGFYVDSSGSQQGLLLTGSGTSWAATQAPLPADAASDPGVSLQSVACASAGPCVATGWYHDAAGNQHGLLITGSGTSWLAAAAPLPADAAADPYAIVHTAACPSATACIAGGSYTDASGQRRGLLLTGSGTTWTAAPAPVPSDSNASQNVTLLSTACPTATSCIVAGYYLDSSFTYQGVLLSGWGTSWTATEAPLPSDANASDGVTPIAMSVACQSATSCLAAGGYTDSSGKPQGLLLSGSGSSWTAAAAPLPADAWMAGTLLAVACAPTTSCTVTGTYSDTSRHGQALLLSGPG